MILFQNSELEALQLLLTLNLQEINPKYPRRIDGDLIIQISKQL
jgi:hypothetical protein